jgi:hypothetical protein
MMVILVHKLKLNYRKLKGNPSWWGRYNSLDNNSIVINIKEDK